MQKHTKKTLLRHIDTIKSMRYNDTINTKHPDPTEATSQLDPTEATSQLKASVPHRGNLSAFMREQK